MTTKPEEPDYSDFAPLSDGEIEQLMHQEPINQGIQLPANEETGPWQ